MMWSTVVYMEDGQRNRTLYIALFLSQEHSYNVVQVKTYKKTGTNIVAIQQFTLVCTCKWSRFKDALKLHAVCNSIDTVVSLSSCLKKFLEKRQS